MTLKKKHETEEHHVSGQADAPEHNKGAATPHQDAAAHKAANHEHHTQSTDEAANLKESLAKAEAKVAELEKKCLEFNDKYIRTVADFDNYRKRSSKEISIARGQALEDTAYPFLQVFDYFSKAMEASEKTSDVASMRAGLKMILAQFQKSLSDLGIEQINCEGQDFNPNFHEAIQKEHSDTIKEGKIIKQWTCAYKLGDKLIRPASVVVSSGPAPAAEKESAKDGGKIEGRC